MRSSFIRVPSFLSKIPPHHVGSCLVQGFFFTLIITKGGMAVQRLALLPHIKKIPWLKPLPEFGYSSPLWQLHKRFGVEQLV